MATTAPHNSTVEARDPLWLCLHFSRLSLDIFQQAYEPQTEKDSIDSRPIAVVEQRRIHCANRDNLPPGLSLATAHALYPELLVIERKAERELEYLHQLAHWAYQFTPGVVIANRNSLLLEIGSCRQLHRGTHNLLKKIQRSLQQRNHQADFGLARTPKAAWLLAQCACEPALRNSVIDDDLLAQQLANIPIDRLEIATQSQQTLDQMGLTTFAALRDLPTAALGKRFGTVFVDYLQKVIGALPDPQLFFTPSPRFQYGLAFIDGIAQRQMLLFPMKRLLQSLDDYLRARQLHCHTLQWQLFDAHRLQAEFSIELSRTHNRWQNLLELSRIKLDQMPLEGMVFSLNLICENFFEAEPNAQALFPDENDRREASAALIDRLQARLGNDALQRIEVQESHWPEMAGQYKNQNRSVPTIRHSSQLFATTRRKYVPIGSGPESVPATVAANNWDDRLASEPFYRPLWLLPHPKPLAVNNNQPYWPTPLTLLRGPERIGNHWWHAEESERDYYIARNARGVVCWIYCEHPTQRWFLHGLFA